MHPASSDLTPAEPQPEHTSFAPRRRRPGRDDQIAPLSAHRGVRPSQRERRPLRRLGAGTLAAAAVLAGTAVVGLPAANAVPVPYAVPFEDDVPAIAPGGQTEAYLDCDNDAFGAAVPVSVTDPSANVTAYEVVTEQNESNSRVTVEVGPDGLFVANQLGTWSVTVSCTGFDPFVSTFEVVNPALSIDLAIDRDYDCATADEAFLPGDRERVCITVTNNTAQDIRQIAALTPHSGTYDYPAAGEVGPGESYVMAAGAGDSADFAGGTIEGLRVWAELGTDGSGDYAVSYTQSLAYEPLGPPIGLTATTGLTSGTACAADGGLVDRTVAPGTPVYLCYTMTNTSGDVYHFHDIADSALGNLYTGLENDVATFETMSWSPSQPVVVTSAETHTGTWSSTVDDPEGYSGLPEGFVATADATATIAVTTAPAPPAPSPADPTPTTTAAPVPAITYVIVTGEAAPAVAVTVEPRMAG